MPATDEADDWRRPRAIVKGTGPRLERVEVERALSDVPFQASAEQDVLFRDARLTRVDFSHQEFGYFYGVNSVFEECSFRGTRFQGVLSGLPQSVFRGCDFSSAMLLHVHPGQARFERCRFANVEIRRWDSRCAEFVDCYFSGILDEARFCGRPTGACAEAPDLNRMTNEFRGNDFRDAELRWVSFVNGIDLAAQHLPESDDYVYLPEAASRISRALREIESLPDEEARNQAKRMLQVWAIESRNQRDLFLSRRPLPTISPEVAETVLRILEGMDPNRTGMRGRWPAG